MSSKKITIIGGGAAGIFAAINIAEKNPSFSVTVLEKSLKVLSKVKVSGGGRCNVTNALTGIAELSKNYPRGEKELKKLFYKFSTLETVKWFADRGVKLKAEADGRMFPVTDSSQTIIDCLLKACDDNGVRISYQTGIKKIERTGPGFSLYTDTGQAITCDALVIATGGSPKMESYQWLRELGHSIVPPVPSLFTFNIKNSEITSLLGLSVKQCQVKIAGTKLMWNGPLLITHWGFSGPAVLKLSSLGARLLHEMAYNYTVLINWLNGAKEQDVREKIETFKLQNPLKYVANACPFELPKRLWEFLVLKTGINPDLKWVNVNGKTLNKLLTHLINDEYDASGKTTFKEEFVTCGGISLKEVDFETMQSKICPGLYFCGEVLDIDGITGGFNFQAAWSTAWVLAEEM
ncbi:MAG: NAD(P)/FAD-dependent oxidoreductase [Bacteroidetes bacterium]|nr:NAD(P)/FAD-dependent oxidoreductase [Bacteroidota bacterium]